MTKSPKIAQEPSLDSPLKVYDIVIVGAGAAGMTAAIYALRAKKSVLIFEETTFGGQIVNTYKIDNYPGTPGISGVEFAKTLKSQVESFGGEFEFSAVGRIEEISSSVKSVILGSSDSPALFKTFAEDGKFFFSKTVILANGSAERKLGLREENRFFGRGVSYCATCDGGFFKDKTVAVYGGGNTALYSALYLSNLAKKVFIVIRRDRFRAEPHLVKKLKSLPNVEVVKNSVITALSGEKSLESITLSTKTGLKESSVALPLDGLFVSIGRIPDNERFRNLVKLDEQGYIKSDESCKTSRAGVFCAGDTRKKPLHQLVTATSDGAVSAMAAVELLNSEA